MSHNVENLKRHILPLSQASSFDAAIREWDLVSVEITEETDRCPCGQEIKEHCYIRNRVTGSQTYVGNVCINRFMHMETNALFQGLKRIRDDPKANANVAVIEYARENGFLFENEYGFLISTARKRNLSERQISWKEKINFRILSRTVVRKRSR